MKVWQWEGNWPTTAGVRHVFKYRNENHWKSIPLWCIGLHDEVTV